MTRNAANEYLKPMQLLVSKHLDCLTSCYAMLRGTPLTEKDLAVMATLKQDLDHLEDQTHWFAQCCKKDKESTIELVKRYSKKFKSCELLYQEILCHDEYRLVLAHEEAAPYTAQLDAGFRKLRKQLHKELPAFFVRVIFLAESSSAAAGSARGNQVSDRFPEKFPRGTSFTASPGPDVPLPEAPFVPNFTAAGGYACSGQPPPAAVPLSQEQILMPEMTPESPRPASRFPDASEGENNFPQLFQAFLLWLERKLENEGEEVPKKKKRGPKGRNSESSIKKKMYYVLMVKIDLFLMKFLPKAACYWILSKICGGNYDDTAHYIRETRKHSCKRHDLEGAFPEVDREFLNRKINVAAIVP